MNNDYSATECPTSGVGIGQVVLGCYRLRAVIGRSTHGTTYLAQHLHEDRMAAVQIADRTVIDKVGEQVAGRRFNDELHGGIRTRHPNLVTTYLAGRTDGVLPTVAMELVPGHTLAQELEACPLGLSSEVLGPCFAQLGSALLAMHNEGSVVRDLSPRKVLFDPGAGGRPRVTVRRLSMRCLRGPSYALRHRGAQTYLAPEQRVGRAVPASDIYALGLMLWWSLTGDEPMPIEADAAHHDDEVAQRLRCATPRLPEPVRELLGAMLAAHEHARPTADEFVRRWPAVVASLGRGLARRSTASPVAAEPATNGAQPLPFVRRRRERPVMVEAPCPPPPPFDVDAVTQDLSTAVSMFGR
ncbi:MAG: protein kinase [Deltaproteobacteria bacterium]|nr:protein kinase [Deltaproteobacteria bacterium]